MRVCKVRLLGLLLVPESGHGLDGDDASKPSGRGSEKGCGGWEANQIAVLKGVYF